MRTNRLINDISSDIYFMSTSKLKTWQNPVDGNTANVKMLRNNSSNRFTGLAPERWYRCYTYLNDNWCFQGIFAGDDRFERLNNLDI